MAFKTVKSYNEERYGGLFTLQNDGDTADVVFLYQSVDDVLVADTHYIKSLDYNGYVHCTGDRRNCPACQKGIRIQTKLFIPVYNIQKNEIEFWDRTPRFEPQLMQDVFKNYPNPSEFVFRITRHGVAGDINTTYEINVVGNNRFKPYGQILAEHNAISPDFYSQVCREVSAEDMRKMISDSSTPTTDYNPSYAATPRGAAAANVTSVETPTVEMPTYSEPPAYVPDETEVQEDTVGDAHSEIDEDPEF